jgi:hypothetical protein
MRLSIFEKLSEELCFNCLSHLDYADLLSISESSKYLNRLADDNYVDYFTLLLVLDHC